MHTYLSQINNPHVHACRHTYLLACLNACIRPIQSSIHVCIHVHAFIIHMIHANRERERERDGNCVLVRCLERNPIKRLQWWEAVAPVSDYLSQRCSPNLPSARPTITQNGDQLQRPSWHPTVALGRAWVIHNKVHLQNTRRGRQRKMDVWWNMTARIPPKVKAFGVLLLKGKILTRDVMRRRNINVRSGDPFYVTTALLNQQLTYCSYVPKQQRYGTNYLFH